MTRVFLLVSVLLLCSIVTSAATSVSTDDHDDHDDYDPTPAEQNCNQCNKLVQSSQVSGWKVQFENATKTWFDSTEKSLITYYYTVTVDSGAGASAIPLGHLSILIPESCGPKLAQLYLSGQKSTAASWSSHNENPTADTVIIHTNGEANDNWEYVTITANDSSTNTKTVYHGYRYMLGVAVGSSMSVALAFDGSHNGNNDNNHIHLGTVAFAVQGDKIDEHGLPKQVVAIGNTKGPVCGSYSAIAPPSGIAFYKKSLCEVKPLEYGSQSNLQCNAPIVTTQLDGSTDIEFTDSDTTHDRVAHFVKQHHNPLSCPRSGLTTRLFREYLGSWTEGKAYVECEQDIQFVDESRPTVEFTADSEVKSFEEVECGSVKAQQFHNFVGCKNNNAFDDYSVVTYSDNCETQDNLKTEFNCTSWEQPACKNIVYSVRTYTVSDSCGNSKCKTQTLVILDTQAPQLSDAPENINEECNQQNHDANYFLSQSEASSLVHEIGGKDNGCGYENCPNNDKINYHSDFHPGNCAGSYTIVRSWSKTDCCGQTTTVFQRIIVQDTTAPQVWVDPSYKVNADNNGQNENHHHIHHTLECDSPNISFKPNVFYKDDCGTNVEGQIPNDPYMTETSTQSSDVNACSHDHYHITRTWTWCDACGNSNSTTVIVNVHDSTDPEFDLTSTQSCLYPTSQAEIQSCNIDPAKVDLNSHRRTMECQDIPPFEDLKAKDNCDTQVSQTKHQSNATNFNCVNDRLIYRSWEIKDNCDHTTTFTYELNIDDVTPTEVDPTTLPKNLYKEKYQCHKNAPSLQLGADQVQPKTCVQQTGWTSEKCNLCDWSVQGELEIYDVPALPANTCKYDVSRKYRYKDCSDNTESNPQQINFHVEDDTSPTVNQASLNAIKDKLCSFSEFSESDEEHVCNKEANHFYVECTDVDEMKNLAVTSADYKLLFEDNCSAQKTVTPSVVDDRSTAGCSEGPILLVWFTTDDCNNQQSQTLTINVVDTVLPTATAPVALDLDCAALTNLEEYLEDPTSVADTCKLHGNPVRPVLPWTTGYPDTQECDNNRTITRYWTIWDACSNSITVSQVINISDKHAPVIQNSTGHEQSNAEFTVECDAIPDIPKMCAVDNCHGVTLKFTESKETFNICDKTNKIYYKIVRTWTATDQCNSHTTVLKHTIYVKDSYAPETNLPINQTSSCEPAAVQQQTAYKPQWLDKCKNIDRITPVPLKVDKDPVYKYYVDGIETSKSVITAKSCQNYDIVVSWSAEDYCGNANTVSYTVQVSDNTSPTFDKPPGDTTVECKLPKPYNLGVHDNCDKTFIPGSTVTSTDSDGSVDPNCPYKWTTTRSWNVVDHCSNANSTSQVIQVDDTTDPKWVVASLPKPTQTVVCFEDLDNSKIPTATDNCSGDLNSHRVGLQKPTFHIENNVTTARNKAKFDRVWIVYDECQHSISYTESISVDDDTLPQVIPPADFKPSITTQCSAPPPPKVCAEDNCHGVQLHFNETRVDIPKIDDGNTLPNHCKYNMIYEWYATDHVQQSDTTTQIIHVEDITPPTFHWNKFRENNPELSPLWTPPLGIDAAHFDANGPTNGQVYGTPEHNVFDCDLPQHVTPPIATDNCDDEVHVNDDSQVPTEVCIHNKTAIIKYSVSDDCGNDNTITFTLKSYATGDYTFVWSTNNNNANTGLDTHNLGSADVDSEDPLPPKLNLHFTCAHEPPHKDASASTPCGDSENPIHYWQGNKQNTLETYPLCQDIYTVLRTWEATALCYPKHTFQQTIHGNRVVPPHLTKTGNNFTVAGNNHVECYKEAQPDSEAEGQDSCGNFIAYFASSPSNNHRYIERTGPVITYPSSHTATCNDYIETYTFTPRDDCGLVGSSITQVFDHIDTQAPVINIVYPYLGTKINDKLVQYDFSQQAQCQKQPHLPVVVSDNCEDQRWTNPANFGSNANFDFTHDWVEPEGVQFDDQCPYRFKVLFNHTASDGCHSVSKDYVDQYLWTVAPKVFGDDLNFPDGEYACDQVPTPKDIQFKDACGQLIDKKNITYNEVRTDQECDNKYQLVRTWTAKDVCGLTTSVVHTYDIVDQYTPDFNTFPANIVVQCGFVPPRPAICASSHCPGVTLDFKEKVDKRQGDNCCDYTITRTWTATSQCAASNYGVNEYTQTITVINTVPPVITGIPTIDNGVDNGPGLPKTPYTCAFMNGKPEGNDWLPDYNATVESRTPDLYSAYCVENPDISDPDTLICNPNNQKMTVAFASKTYNIEEGSSKLLMMYEGVLDATKDNVNNIIPIWETVNSGHNAQPNGEGKLTARYKSSDSSSVIDIKLHFSGLLDSPPATESAYSPLLLSESCYGAQGIVDINSWKFYSTINGTIDIDSYTYELSQTVGKNSHFGGGASGLDVDPGFTGFIHFEVPNGLNTQPYDLVLHIAAIGFSGTDSVCAFSPTELPQIVHCHNCDKLDVTWNNSYVNNKCDSIMNDGQSWDFNVTRQFCSWSHNDRKQTCVNSTFVVVDSSNVHWINASSESLPNPIVPEVNNVDNSPFMSPEFAYTIDMCDELPPLWDIYPHHDCSEINANGERRLVNREEMNGLWSINNATSQDSSLPKVSGNGQQFCDRMVNRSVTVYTPCGKPYKYNYFIHQLKQTQAAFTKCSTSVTGVCDYGRHDEDTKDKECNIQGPLTGDTDDTGVFVTYSSCSAMKYICSDISTYGSLAAYNPNVCAPPANPSYLAPTSTGSGKAKVDYSFYVDNKYPHDCASKFERTYHYEVEDDCGQILSATYVSTVNDAEKPIITWTPNPSNTLECTQDYTPLWSYDDNCDIPDDTEHREPSSDNKVPLYPGCAEELLYKKKYHTIATDACGNDDTQTQEITSQDTISPKFDYNNWTQDMKTKCYQDLTEGKDCTYIKNIDCSETPEFPPINGFDSCYLKKVVLGFPNPQPQPANEDACSGKYTLTQTYYTEDCAGHKSPVFTFVFNVTDGSGPSIEPSEPTDIYQNDNCTVPDIPTRCASDNCKTVTLTFDQHRVETGYSIDNPLDTASAFLERNIDLERENCDRYNLVREWHATDACGNTDSQSYTVHFNDVDAPDFKELQNPIENAEPTPISCSAFLEGYFDNHVPIVSGTPSEADGQILMDAKDTCSSPTAVTRAHLSVPILAKCEFNFTRTYTYKAYDSCGNLNTTTYKYKVIDDAVPTINNVPATNSLTKECTAALIDLLDSGADKFPLTSDFDTCNDNIIAFLESNPADRTPNSATGCVYHNHPCYKSLETHRTVDPFWNYTGQDGKCHATRRVTYESTDNCNVPAVSETLNVTWNDNVAPFLICGTPTSCLQQHPGSPSSCKPPASGSCLPQNKQIECNEVDDNPQEELWAWDDCTGWLQAHKSEVDPFSDIDGGDQCPNTRKIQRKWSVSDCAGHVTEHTQIITVVDTIAPELNAKPDDVHDKQNQYINNDLCIKIPDFQKRCASDNCGTVSLKFEKDKVYQNMGLQNATCNQYYLNYTVIATDCAGNHDVNDEIPSKRSYYIYVDDTTPPAWDSQPPSPGYASAECDDPKKKDPTPPTASDVCEGWEQVTQVEPLPLANGNNPNSNAVCHGNYDRVFKYSTEDACKNSPADWIYTVHVKDTLNPTWTLVPDNKTEVSFSCANDNIHFQDPIPSDTCDSRYGQTPSVEYVSDSVGDEILNSKIPGDYSWRQEPTCRHNNKVVRTWKVTDHCNNFDIATQTIKITDTVGPVRPADLAANSDTSFNCNEELVFPEWCPTDDCSSINWKRADGSVIDSYFNAQGKKCIKPVYTAVTGQKLADLLAASQHGHTACDNHYFFTWYYEASDFCGHKTTATVNVEVFDDSEPVINDDLLQSDPIKDGEYFSTHDCASIPAPPKLCCGDTCEGLTMDFSQTVNAKCGAVFELHRLWTCKDDCGNVATSVKQFVNVTSEGENAKPQFVTTSNDYAQVTRASNSVYYECINDEPLWTLTANAHCLVSSSVAGPDKTATPPTYYTELDDADGAYPGSFDDQTYCKNHRYTEYRVWTATDECGNMNAITQTIHVNDTKPPNVTHIDPICIQSHDKVSKIPLPHILQNKYWFTAVEACTKFHIAFKSCTSDQDISPENPDGLEPNCQFYDIDNGKLIIDGTAILPGTLKRTYYVTVTVTDSCGNSVDDTQEIHLQYSESSQTLDKDCIDQGNCANSCPAQTAESYCLLGDATYANVKLDLNPDPSEYFGSDQNQQIGWTVSWTVTNLPAASPHQVQLAIDLSKYNLIKAQVNGAESLVKLGSVDSSFLSGITFQEVHNHDIISVVLEHGTYTPGNYVNIPALVGNFANYNFATLDEMRGCSSLLSVEFPDLAVSTVQSGVANGKVVVDSIVDINADTPLVLSAPFAYPLRGVVIELTNSNHNILRYALTDENGEYHLSGLPTTSQGGVNTTGLFVTIREESVLRPNKRSSANFLVHKGFTGAIVYNSAIGSPNEPQFGPAVELSPSSPQTLSLAFLDPLSNNPAPRPVYSWMYASSFHFHGTAKPTAWWIYNVKSSSLYNTVNYALGSSSSFVNFNGQALDDVYNKFIANALPSSVLATCGALAVSTWQSTQSVVKTALAASDHSSLNGPDFAAAVLNTITGNSVFEPYDTIAQIYLDYALSVYCSGSTSTADLNRAALVVSYINKANDFFPTETNPNA